MSEPLVIVYVGDGQRGLDVVRAFDQRTERPVHLLTADVEEVTATAGDPAVGAVICGSIDPEDRRRVADGVATSAPELPVFDLDDSAEKPPKPADFRRVDVDGEPRNGVTELFADGRERVDSAPEREVDGPGKRFEDTIERITDAFFALDNEDRFVLLNGKAEELLDVDQDEVAGVRLWDAFPAALGTRFYEEFQEAMETQEPASFEEYYQPQGRWFEVNAYPSREGLSVFLRDVTEQRELRQKLEALHDVTRELIVAESDGEIADRTVAAAEEILGFRLVTVWRHDEATGTLDPLAWSDPVADRNGRPEPRGPESEFLWEVYESGESRHLGFVPATTSSSHHPGKVDSELLVPVGEYGVLGAYSDERDAFDETDVELRSEERRVGKECFLLCRSRWSPYH